MRVFYKFLLSILIFAGSGSVFLREAFGGEDEFVLTYEVQNHEGIEPHLTFVSAEIQQSHFLESEIESALADAETKKFLVRPFRLHEGLVRFLAGVSKQTMNNTSATIKIIATYAAGVIVYKYTYSDITGWRMSRHRWHARSFRRL